MIQVDEAQVCLQQAQAYWQEQNWQLTIQACAKALALNETLTDAHKLMGDALQRIGKTKEAIGYYLQAIAIEPDFAEVYANLGALYARDKQWDRAVAHYQKAIKSKPNFVAAYRLLAKVYQIKNEPHKAQACLTQAKIKEAELSGNQTVAVDRIADNGNKSQSLPECLSQAQVFKERGEFKAALEQYQQAASIDPQRLETYTEIVSLCEQLELWQEAAKYCRIVLKLSNSGTATSPAPSPSPQVDSDLENPVRSYTAKAEYHYNLGTLYGGKQEWAEAVKQYQEAIAIDPQMAKAHRNLARALSQLGDKQRSTEYWLKAVSLENQGVDVKEYLELAQNLASWGKIDSAIVCYRRAIEQQPDLVAAYLGWGELLVQGGYSEEAIACYVQGLKHVQDGEIYYRLGRLYRATEEWSKAALCYQKATQYSPEHGAAYHELGEILSHKAQWNKAIAAYRQAIKFKADFSWSYNNLGYALIQLGQWSEAIPIYQRAIELNPDFPWSYHNLAEAYSKLHQWSEAVESFQQAAKLQPDLPHIQQKLGDALYQRSLQDKELALKHFNLAIQQEPDEPEAYVKALAIDKMNLELYLKLGDILASRGETEQAIATFQTALQIQPKNSVAIARLQEIALPGDAQASLPNPPAPQIIEFSREDLKF